MTRVTAPFRTRRFAICGKFLVAVHAVFHDFHFFKLPALNTFFYRSTLLLKFGMADTAVLISFLVKPVRERNIPFPAAVQNKLSIFCITRNRDGQKHKHDYGTKSMSDHVISPLASDFSFPESSFRWPISSLMMSFILDLPYFSGTISFMPR